MIREATVQDTIRRRSPAPDLAHQEAVAIEQRAAVPRARLLLLSILSITALLYGIVAMHAQLADAGSTPSTSMSATYPTAASGMESGTALAAATDPMDHGMGGMGAMDCLSLGMMCLFGVVALLLLVLAVRLRSQLRRRLAVRTWAAAVAGPLRPPEPPSLLVLSISRT
jgi:uncharacterized membrane protein YeiB